MSAEDWTPDRTHLLRQYRIVDGLSSGEIAKRINRETGSRFSRNAVIGKLIRLGIEPPVEVKGKRKNVSKAQHAQARGKAAPPMIFAPVRERGAPRGSHNIPFKDRNESTCLMFVGGESHDTGLICGRGAYGEKPYCKDCCKIAYLPPEKRRAVA